jgi:serpin B
MKGFRAILCIAAASTVGFSGCAQNNEDIANNKYIIEAKALSNSNEVVNISSANNKLAFKFLKETVDSDTNKNTVISPLSLSTVLTLTQNGAANKTKEEMLTSLELGKLSDSEINDSYKNLIGHLNSLKGINVKLANSIWVSKGYDIKKEFTELSTKYFEAENYKIDFTSKTAANRINDWVFKHTKGKIKKLEDSFDSDVLLALINTVYFKGEWSRPFERKNTKLENFTASDNSSSKVEMMDTQSDFEYLRGEDFEAVRLPYSNKTFGMYVFLPDKNKNVKQFVDNFTFQKWNNYIKNFEAQELVVKLPKFKVEYEQELKDMLINFGMKSAFELSADFSRLTSKSAAISKVKQKCFIEVDEAGTEAAAATEVQMKDMSMVVGNIKQFAADRPFVYVIADNNTGMILFMGTVEKPQ